MYVRERCLPMSKSLHHSTLDATHGDSCAACVPNNLFICSSSLSGSSQVRLLDLGSRGLAGLGGLCSEPEA